MRAFFVFEGVYCISIIVLKTVAKWLRGYPLGLKQLRNGCEMVARLSPWFKTVAKWLRNGCEMGGRKKDKIPAF
jgi:hypothetical protein